MAKLLQDLGDHPLNRFAHVPSLVWFHDSVGLTPDLAMELLCLGGMALGTLAAANILIAPETFGAMWLSYLSVILMGGSFTRFQWDSLLLEVGFLAIWLAPPFGNSSLFEPPQIVLWALRFVFVKFSFMTSVSKILSGCPTWLGLTALDYHFATQELPNPLSWYAHQLSVPASLYIQGPLVLLSLSPSAWHRYPVFYLNLALHISSLFTGNYGFSNALAIALAYTVLPAATDPQTDRFKSVQYTAIAVGFLGLTITTYSMFEVVYENNQPTGLRYAFRVGQTQQALKYIVPGVVWGALGVAAVAAVWQNLRLLYAGCVDLMHFRIGGAFASGHCALFSVIGLLVFGGLVMPVAQLHPGCSDTLPDVIKTASVVASRLRVSSAYGSMKKATGIQKVTIPGTFVNEFAIVARPEVILEGSADDGKTWHALDFRHKPGNAVRAQLYHYDFTRLCHVLVTLHLLDHIRIYLIASFAVFMLAKVRLDRWLTPLEGGGDVAGLVNKQKLLWSTFVTAAESMTQVFPDDKDDQPLRPENSTSSSDTTDVIVPNSKDEPSLVTFLQRRCRLRTPLGRECISEFFSTFVMMGFGGGSGAQVTLSNGQHGNYTHITLCWGIAVMLGIHVGGAISGAHMNPAVSFTFCVLGKLPWGKLPWFCLSQLSGAFCAAWVVFLMYYPALTQYDPEFTMAKSGRIFVSGPQTTETLLSAFVTEESLQSDIHQIPI
ncbi:hypothetical protein B5M09_006908 [Aphanomyces astaci]|uniref:Lipase maturation factor 1/2 N-terminal domain-containing protein n=1 Tax=Aphanomyces astaci TaxID=112090 RepID=A0A425C399_APHAT|nr:hypothetical protein B5M09_006908 [Aphanomyces astaci]